MVAPAIVAIYAIDANGAITFDRALSAETRGSVDTRVQLTDVAVMDLKRIESTPIQGAEFYNRMNLASAQVTNRCLEPAASCTARAVAYEATVSRNFKTWEQPLGADYVVFLRVTGAYETASAIQNTAATAVVTGFALGGVIGGVIGGIYAASLPPGGAVASMAVLDLKQGRIVWFKHKRIANSRSIPETCNAMAELLNEMSGPAGLGASFERDGLAPRAPGSAPPRAGAA